MNCLYISLQNFMKFNNPEINIFIAEYLKNYFYKTLNYSNIFEGNFN